MRKCVQGEGCVGVVAYAICPSHGLCRVLNGAKRQESEGASGGLFATHN